MRTVCGLPADDGDDGKTIADMSFRVTEVAIDWFAWITSVVLAA